MTMATGFSCSTECQNSRRIAALFAARSLLLRVTGRRLANNLADVLRPHNVLLSSNEPAPDGELGGMSKSLSLIN
jgi:hypothetical protein